MLNDRGRPVWILGDSTLPQFFYLVATTDRYFLTGLSSICQPPMEHDRHGSVQIIEGDTCLGSPSLAMCPILVISVDILSYTSGKGNDRNIIVPNYLCGLSQMDLSQKAFHMIS